MNREQIKRLTELRSREKSLQLLELGAELAQQRDERYPNGLPYGSEPRSFHEELIGDGAVFLRELHGIRQPRATEGRAIRRIGEIRAGRRAIVDRVMPARALNSQRRIAQRRRRGENVADMAERQLLLTMMDSANTPRLCAAYAYWQATGATEVVVPILAKGLESDDMEEFEVACHSLAKMGPAGTRRLRPHVGTAADDRPNSPVHPHVQSMTVLIHGTFAKNQPWYKPGGDFHSYIQNNVYNDLYGANDYFFWSGRYSDPARQAAARKLVTWCAEHPTSHLRLIAHSHGANVVNLATRLGLETCTLIHLSPPVHNQYLPDATGISSARFFTIRPRIDLVVFIDGGAHDYRITPVAALERRRIIALEGHSESHEANRWRAKDVPGLVKTVCP